MAFENSLTVNVKAGPVFGAICDVLNSAEEFAELIPDWHSKERDEFLDKCRMLKRIAMLSLQAE